MRDVREKKSKVSSSIIFRRKVTKKRHPTAHRLKTEVLLYLQKNEKRLLTYFHLNSHIPNFVYFLKKKNRYKSASKNFAFICGYLRTALNTTNDLLLNLINPPPNSSG